MKNIGIIANQDRDIDLQNTIHLVETISKFGAQPLVSASISEKTGAKSGGSEEEVIEASDVVMVLGGDGTFLKTARIAYPKKKPLLGVNLGNLGFLTEVDKKETSSAVESLVTENYQIEERMMLDSSVIRDGNTIAYDVALNDIVIARGALSRILHVKAYVNDTVIDMFPGDGLIVSSPTGSTAYSLSAGGPIVEPDTELIIVTPICPHILYSRAFVTTGDRVIRAEIEEVVCYDAMVTVDGQTGYTIQGGDIIEVKRSSHKVRMVNLGRRDFFNILRKKIYDRGARLRKDEI
ncbi:MAG TPA: NAD(+)/NADH kinase [Clostridia bacterium]